MIDCEYKSDVVFIGAVKSLFDRLAFHLILLEYSLYSKHTNHFHLQERYQDIIHSELIVIMMMLWFILHCNSMP